MVPHDWQAEELLRFGGYLNPYDLSTQIEFTRENPLLYILSAGNSSGKDQFVISTVCVWFVLVGLKNRAIFTSASFRQVKDQTEPGIKFLVDRCNQVYGRIFRSVEFHHLCLLTGSEIKLFATDDPGQAEGYHPWHGGKMLLGINEAKSFSAKMYEAFMRCEGYSYWIEISSPGPKSGKMYQHAQKAIQYPETPVPNKYWLRYVSQLECPHIPRANIQRLIDEMPDWWVQSSVYGRFSDANDTIIIPNRFIERLKLSLPNPDGADIGIGLDVAAGVDENACYVRQGNRILDKFFFRQRDTTETVPSIDTFLAPYRDSDYIFNADDGGISKAILDGLVKLKWRITRRNNQSPAYDKSKFLNLGIEMWWRIRTFILRREIVPDFDDERFIEQLTSRRYDGEESAQGKFKIESKAEHIARTGSSPDRADAFILCFFSFKSQYFSHGSQAKVQTHQPRFKSFEHLASVLGWDNIENVTKPHNGKFTFQNVKL